MNVMPGQTKQDDGSRGPESHRNDDRYSMLKQAAVQGDVRVAIAEVRVGTFLEQHAGGCEVPAVDRLVQCRPPDEATGTNTQYLMKRQLDNSTSTSRKASNPCTPLSQASIDQGRMLVQHVEDLRPL